MNKRLVPARVLFTFETPDAEDLQIIPAFYSLFYIDCKGKPALSQSVRFDNNIMNISATAKAP